MKNFIFFKTKLQAVIFLIALLSGVTLNLFAQASITVSPNTLNGFTHIVNSGSSPVQSFTVNGSGLTDNVTLTSSLSYEISDNPSSNFGSTITLTQSGGNVLNATVYVRLKKELIISTYSEDVTIASNGATSRTVTCNGSVTCVPSDFAFRQAEITKILGSPVFTPDVSSSSITPTVVYSSSNESVAAVGVNGVITIGAITGRVTISASHEAGGGLCATTTSFILNVIQPPIVTVSHAALNSFSAVNGGASSAEQTFTVSGSLLTSNIELMAPANYEISTTSGSVFGASLTLIPSSGVVTNTTIYARLKAGLPASDYNNEEITVKTDFAVSKSVFCSGIVSRAASNLDFGTALSKTLDSPKFTRIASSLNTTTAISYSGSDDKVATVDPVTGEVTIIGLGQVVLTATQIAGTHNAIEYLASTASYTLTVYTGPVVIVSTNALTGFTYSAGTGPSKGQSFTVRGSNLTGDITVTAPANYEISISETANFGASVNLTQALGGVPLTTIYVRLKSDLYVMNYAENVLITSRDAIDKTVACSGNVTCGISTLAFSETTVVKALDNPNFTLQVTEPKGATLTYSSSRPLVATVNELGEVDILTEGSTEISVSHEAVAGLCAATASYVLNVIQTPLITVFPVTLSAFSAISGMSSAEQMLTVGGALLANDIILTAPVDYEISITSGSAFSSSITLAQVGGVVASTSVYIRLKAGLAVSNFDNEAVTVSSTLAVPKSVFCSGSVTCASSQLAFLVTRVEKKMGNVPFSELTTSGNGTTAIEYSSSVPTVASVNASTGEVTLVSDGQTDITATQAAGLHNSKEYCAATDMYTLNVAVGPTITVTPAVLSDFTYTAGSAVPEKSFSVSGSLLSNNILITAPANYEISTGTGVDFKPVSPIELVRTGNVVAATTIYARLKTGINVGAYPENIMLTSTDAAAKSIACTGNVLCLPCNLNFGVAIVTKAPGVVAFTETASIHRPGSINYLSSVPEVATVNSSTGEVTVMSAGSTIISASQAEGAGYCSCIATYRLNVGVPVILITESLIPDLIAEVGSADSEIITVNGNYLTEDITVAVNNPSLFVLSVGSLSQADGIVLNKPVVITYSPEFVGKHTATLTLSSLGAASVTRQLSGTATSDPGTLLNQISVDLKVSVVNGKLQLLATGGERIEAYDAIGRKVVSELAVDGVNTIAVSAHGLILVKVGSRVAKVIL